MSESDGKAVMPGVGFIIMSISSFWRLGGVSGRASYLTACAEYVVTDRCATVALLLFIAMAMFSSDRARLEALGSC
jgi:hypothetical protein